jgi:pimeloyl-ACP methyl ester carboxylesterase
MSTYVLVHGAYQGGWIWQPVTDRLRAAGHDVYAPSLDGCAERRGALRPGITTESHGTEVADLLFYEDLSQVILVGTSSGGMVACRAAELAPDRIARLVFVDALALDTGERIGDIVNRPPTSGDHLATGPTRQDVESRMFAHLDGDLRTWAADRVTPHPIAVMEEPVELESFWTRSWSAHVIRCLRSPNPPLSHQQRTADRLGASWRELDTGHYPMLSTPDELTTILLHPAVDEAAQR